MAIAPCVRLPRGMRHASDHQDRIRIATADSPLGTALLRLYGLNPEDPESWLMIEGGRAFGSLDAMLRLSAGLHPLFRLATPLRWLPFAVQDWLYARLARNRYALFGRTDMCALPDPALRRKLVP